MGLFSFLNPMKAISSTKTLAKDISNYVFYRRQVKKMNDQGLFKNVNGRVDALRRVYYVLNLEPETLLATGDLIDLEKSRVFESISKVQGRFADHNLVEIVEVSSERIKSDEYYAYLILIKYDSQFRVKDIFRVISWLAILFFGIAYAIEVIQNFDAVVDSIKNTITTK
jgi:hypothetical protein